MRVATVSCGLVAVVLAVAVGVFFQLFVIDKPDWQTDVSITGTPIKLRRKGSVMEMWGEDNIAMAKALGYAHAKDRLVQMVFQRLIVQGRLSECLLADDKTIHTDTFFRELGFADDARRAIKDNVLSAKVIDYLNAYAEGVNYFMSEEKERFLNFDALALPLEFTLVAHVPEPWKPEDTLATLKLMCYIGLASTQGDAEKLIIQSIKGGVDLNKLKAIFAPRLDHMSDEVVELIKNVRIEQPMLYKRFLEQGLPFSFPNVHASNNWVLSPSLTKDKGAIQCNDPHLEINRLPGIWYEILFHYTGEGQSGRYWFGATVPGIPGVVMGRTADVSYGFTYGFMDQLDFFIEEIKDGKYKTINAEGSIEWKHLKRRFETLHLKGGAKEIPLVFYETQNGVLELSDPHHKNPGQNSASIPEDGLYLVRRWAWGDLSDADFMGLIPPPYFTSVGQAQNVLKSLALSTNFLFADKDGNIGYQQTGRLPNRGPKHGGLFPGIGWLKDYQWNGTVNPDLLHTFTNPEKGWIATANDDWQAEDNPISITLSMGPNRRNRADDLIGGLKDKGVKITPEHMQAMQLDLYSKEAEAYMKVLKPLLPQTPAADILRDWDMRYDRDSRGAVLFEWFWERLLLEVYGNWTFGTEVWRELRTESGLILMFHWVFDRSILQQQEESEIDWFKGEGREAVFRRIANELFNAKAIEKAEGVPTYGVYHSMILKNILFDGKMPLVTGFDAGPIPLEGSRATLMQGNSFKMMGRVSSFAPSWRYIADVSKDEVQTSLPSGPSGRRFSSMYYNHDFYFNGKYHKISMK